MIRLSTWIKCVFLTRDWALLAASLFGHYTTLMSSALLRAAWRQHRNFGVNDNSKCSMLQRCAGRPEDRDTGVIRNSVDVPVTTDNTICPVGIIISRYKYLRLNKAVYTLVVFSWLVPKRGSIQPTAEIQTHQPLLSAHLHFRWEFAGKKTHYYWKLLTIRNGK